MRERPRGRDPERGRVVLYRVGRKGDAVTDTLTSALERSAMPREAKNVLDVVQRAHPRLVKLLGSEQAAERFVVETRSYLYANPKLYEADPNSVASGALWCAQLGLTLGPLGLFYLVPFKGLAVAIVGYKGYCQLAYRSGQVKDISAKLVYEGEPFAEYGGSTPKLVHEIRDHDDDATIAHAYAVARLKTGGTVWTVIGEREWERARKASALGAKNQGLWAEHRPEAIRKTAIRRLAESGSLPLVPALGDALDHDETPAELEDVSE